MNTSTHFRANTHIMLCVWLIMFKYADTNSNTRTALVINKLLQLNILIDHKKNSTSSDNG